MRCSRRRLSFWHSRTMRSTKASWPISEKLSLEQRIGEPGVLAHQRSSTPMMAGVPSAAYSYCILRAMSKATLWPAISTKQASRTRRRSWKCWLRSPSPACGHRLRARRGLGGMVVERRAGRIPLGWVHRGVGETDSGRAKVIQRRLRETKCAAREQELLRCRRPDMLSNWCAGLQAERRSQLRRSRRLRPQSNSTH